MAEATVRRMDWSAHLGLKKLFGGEAPATYGEFADADSQSWTRVLPGLQPVSSFSMCRDP